MTTRTVQDLQFAVSQLSAHELARFRAWFEEFEAKIWDEKFEEDVKSGKLEHLAEQAIADLRAGNCKELYDISPTLNFGNDIKICQEMFNSLLTETSSC